MSAAEDASPALSRRHLIQVGLGTGLLGATSMLALGEVWARNLATDRLTILGSGSELSLFLTAGHARCLIAAGNQPDDFTNALGRSRFPTTRRVDLLLLMPSAISSLGDQALKLAKGRYTARVGTAKLSATTAHFSAIPVLPSPRRIELPNAITIDVETAEIGASDKPELVWCVMIARANSRIVVLSGRDAATHFGRMSPVTLAISPDTVVAETLAALQPHGLVIGEDRAKSAPTIDALGASEQTPPIFTVPSGQTMEITWQSGGLRLDGQTPLPRATGSPATMDAGPRPSPQTLV